MHLSVKAKAQDAKYNGGLPPPQKHTKQHAKPHFPQEFSGAKVDLPETKARPTGLYTVQGHRLQLFTSDTSDLPLGSCLRDVPPGKRRTPLAPPRTTKRTRSAPRSRTATSDASLADIASPAANAPSRRESHGLVNVSKHLPSQRQMHIWPSSQR